MAAAHDLDLDEEADEPSRLSALTEALSTMIGRRPEPGLVLLEDLRDLYLMARRTRWPGRCSRNTRRPSGSVIVLALAERGHPQTLRQMRWTNTMIKTAVAAGPVEHVVRSGRAQRRAGIRGATRRTSAVARIAASAPSASPAATS